jgi:hypothetical protein
MAIELVDADDGGGPAVSTVNEFGGETFETPTVDKKARGDFAEPVIDDTDDELVVEAVGDETESEDETETESKDDEGEDEGETETEEEDEGEDDESKSTEEDESIPSSVPRSRLKKEVEKRKKLQARLDALEAQSTEDGNDDPVESATGIELDPASFKKMQEAMIDGESDTAMELFQGMLNNAVNVATTTAEKRTSEKVKGEIAEQAQNKELAAVSATVYESYPEFEYGGEHADEDLITDVVDLRDFYFNKMSAGEALQKAAAQVALENELVDRKPAAKPKAIDKPPVKAKAKNDIARKMELAVKEKGKLKGSSLRDKSESMDISSLTDEQFGNMSPQAKAKARGDFL